MSRDFKLFLAVLLLSLPFWLGVNSFQKLVEDVYFSRIISDNPPSFFVAQIFQGGKDVEPSQILAESAISVELSENGRERVVFEKNSRQPRPIASISKLMTAIVAEEFYHPELQIQVSKNSVSQNGETGSLTVGEILRVSDLLHIMLIESSNDAAFSLAEVVGVEGFAELMNLKAEEIGMNSSRFFEPTGLDPENDRESPNLSSAEDLVRLAEYIILKKPQILEIISKKEYPLYLENGTFHHLLRNTNQLLWELPNIVGGKTGFTEKAGGCLLVITKGRRPGAYFINVVLNSPDRFGDMEKLISKTKL